MASPRFDSLIPASNEIVQTPSVRYAAQEIMTKRGYNPIERLVDLAEQLEEYAARMYAETQVPVCVEERMKVHNSLLKYHSAQPKSVDINLNSTQSFEIKTISFTGLEEQRAHLLPAAGSHNGPQLLEMTIPEVEDGD
jgi:hypothetical protein